MRELSQGIYYNLMLLRKCSWILMRPEWHKPSWGESAVEGLGAAKFRIYSELRPPHCFTSGSNWQRRRVLSLVIYQSRFGLIQHPLLWRQSTAHFHPFQPSLIKIWKLSLMNANQFFFIKVSHATCTNPSKYLIALCHWIIMSMPAFLSNPKL